MSAALVRAGSQRQAIPAAATPDVYRCVIGNYSCRIVGQTSGLTVSRVSGPEFLPPLGHGVGDSVNRQTGGLTHT